MQPITATQQQLQIEIMHDYKTQLFQLLIATQIQNTQIQLFLLAHQKQILLIDSSQKVYAFLDLFLKQQIQNKIQCIICLQDMKNKIVQLSCKHSFCKPCVKNYLNQLISIRKVEDIPCLYQDCSVKITKKQIKQQLDQQQYDRFQKFLKFNQLSKNPNLRWCTRPDCQKYIIKTKEQQIKLKCQCGQQICFKCGQSWHTNTCQEQIRLRCGKIVQDLSLQKCPNCGLFVEKLSGCNHMSCSKCTYQFCWLCLGQYNQYHYKWWNFLGCPKQQNSQNYWKGWKYILIFFSIPIFIILITILILCGIFGGLAMGFAAPFSLLSKVINKYNLNNGVGCCYYWILGLLGVLIVLPFSMALGIFPGSLIIMYHLIRQNL